MIAQHQEFVAGEQRLPWMIEVGGVGKLKFPVHKQNGVVAITSVKLFDSGGTEVVDMPSQAVVNNVPECQFSAGLVDEDQLGMGFEVRWDLTIDGDPVVFRTEAAVVRRTLFPVITVADLEGVWPGIGEWKPPEQTDWSPQVLETWIQLNARLIGKGSRPQLIMSPWALRNVHLFMSLTAIASRLKVQGGSMWDAKWLEWGTRASAEWDDLTFSYDSDEDGTTDGVVAAPATHILMDMPRSSRRWKW